MCTALTYPEQERRRKAGTKAEISPKAEKAGTNKAERKATSHEKQEQSTEQRHKQGAHACHAKSPRVASHEKSPCEPRQKFMRAMKRFHAMLATR